MDIDEHPTASCADIGRLLLNIFTVVINVIKCRHLDIKVLPTQLNLGGGRELAPGRSEAEYQFIALRVLLGHKGHGYSLTKRCARRRRYCSTE